jgi:hypothetical protein
MAALNEDEPSAEEMVAPARSPAQGFRLGVQNAYAWQPEEQRAERGNLLYEQQLKAMDEARQRPAAVAQQQIKRKDRNIQTAIQGVNTGTLMNQRQTLEAYRQAQIQKIQQAPTMPGMRPGTEGVIRVQGLNGEPRYMPKSEALARLYAGENIDVPFAMQARPGFGPQGAGYYDFNPYSGAGLGGVSPLPTEEAMTNLTQAKVALSGLAAVKKGLREYASQAGPVKRGLTDIMSKIPGGGIVTSYFDPQGNITNSAVLLTRQMFVYMLTGKQINEVEMNLLENAFPRVGENINTAMPKLDKFFGYLYAILQSKNQRTPGLVDPELLRMAAEGAGMQQTYKGLPVHEEP